MREIRISFFFAFLKKVISTKNKHLTFFIRIYNTNIEIAESIQI